MADKIAEIANKLSVLHGVKYELEGEYAHSLLYVFSEKGSILNKIVTDSLGNFIEEVKSASLKELGHLLILQNGHIDSITKKAIYYENNCIFNNKLCYFADKNMYVVDEKNNIIFTEAEVSSMLCFDKTFMLVYTHINYISVYNENFIKIVSLDDWMFTQSVCQCIFFRYVSLLNKENKLLNIFDKQGNKLLTNNVNAIIKDVNSQRILTSFKKEQEINLCVYNFDMQKVSDFNIKLDILNFNRNFIIENKLIIEISQTGIGEYIIKYSSNKDMIGMRVLEKNCLSFEEQASKIYSVIEISKTGRIVNTQSCVYSSYMLVVKNGKKGIIDCKFNIVIKPEYDDIIVLDRDRKCIIGIKDEKRNLYLIDSNKWININADSIESYDGKTGSFSYIYDEQIRSGNIRD